MASVKEAILKNCLLFPTGNGNCEVSEHCGDIVLKYPSGVVRRSRRGAYGDIYIPMEDGREVKMDVSKLFAA